MATIVHEFDWPDRVVVGTVGRPGERSFYLQARSGRRVISVGLEKEQSALLAEKVEEVLDDLLADDENTISIPADTPIELVDNEPLEQPVEPQFRTATIGLGWDPSTAQIVIEAYPFADNDNDNDNEGDEDPTSEPTEMLVIRMPVGTARAFAQRTLEIVGSGRAICPLCGQPMDPHGHDCDS